MSQILLVSRRRDLHAILLHGKIFQCMMMQAAVCFIFISAVNLPLPFKMLPQNLSQPYLKDPPHAQRGHPDATRKCLYKAQWSRLGPILPSPDQPINQAEAAERILRLSTQNKLEASGFPSFLQKENFNWSNYSMEMPASLLISAQASPKNSTPTGC